MSEKLVLKNWRFLGGDADWFHTTTFDKGQDGIWRCSKCTCFGGGKYHVPGQGGHDVIMVPVYPRPPSTQDHQHSL
jgi:hypothetical protein